jgi:hypothetical protein
MWDGRQPIKKWPQEQTLEDVTNEHSKDRGSEH